MPLRFWRRKAAAQAAALDAARAWQDYERRQAVARISGLADELRGARQGSRLSVQLEEIGPDGSKTIRHYRWSGGAR